MPEEVSGRVIRLEERGRTHEDEIKRVFRRISDLDVKVDAIRMDLHAAKVGGRWVIGIALAFGSMLGWAVKPWLGGH